MDAPFIDPSVPGCDEETCSPSRPLQVPDYHIVIKDPVDLSLVETRLKRRDFYITLDIFIADFRRMMNNCRSAWWGREGSRDWGGCAMTSASHLDRSRG